MFFSCLFCKKFLFNKNYCSQCSSSIPVKFHYFYVENMKIYGSCVYNTITSNPIFELKYNFNPFVAKSMAQYIYDQVQISWDFDYLVPIPIKWYKKISRGYNQTSLICHYLSKLTNIPTVDLLKKIDHKTQTNSTAQERIKSPILAIDKQIPSPSKILIMDDVITTGSTMLSAYNLLKNHYHVEGLVFNYSKKFINNFQLNNVNFLMR